MNRVVGRLCIIGLLGMTSFVQGEEKAATSQLPAALQEIGVADGDVVTAKQAHDVRGEHMGYYQPMFANVMLGRAPDASYPMGSMYGAYGYGHAVSGLGRYHVPSTPVFRGPYGGQRGWMGGGGIGGLGNNFYGMPFQRSHYFGGYSQNMFPHTFRRY